MNGRKFDHRVLRKRFGEVLEPHGFTCEGSKRSVFYRKLQNQISHFIAPSYYQYRPTFEVMVFFSSPLIDPRFEESFPDAIGSPSDNCNLRPGHGIERHGSQFPCRDTAAFEAAFAKALGAALTEIAVPYLDRVRSFADMIPLLEHPFYLEAARRAAKAQQSVQPDRREDAAPG